MPTLDFKGKQHIYAHHLSVPYRSLIPDASKSIYPPPHTNVLNCEDSNHASSSSGRSSGNLIIHGDNLHALKALLPTYTGRIKCIYIDPPYNTGSQAWVYNDNVNSPLMRQWLADNKPVDGEDLERHDKWLCMMWPRLQLLRELLAEDGVIFVSIDDHEQWRLLGLMEDVFEERNFIDTLILIQNAGAVSGRYLREVNEFVHVFAKDIDTVGMGLFRKKPPRGGWDEDEIGKYRLGSGLIRIGLSGTPADRPNLYFPIFVRCDGTVGINRSHETDVAVYPSDGNGDPAVWRWSKQKVEREPFNLLVRPHKRMGYQFTIKIRPDMDSVFKEKPTSLWNKPQYSSANGTNAVKAVFDGKRAFDFPKSVALIADILRFADVGPDDIVLDSFAGSGTTAHAVLALNKEDGGNRRFILVECEDYADAITAERVRRVINGVPTARDSVLREGLGGSFTYCTLGDPISIETMLNGENLPGYASLATYLLHCATGIAANPSHLAANATLSDDTGFFYESEHVRYHLLYRSDIEWLRGEKGALNSTRAEAVSQAARAVGKSAVVFAPLRFVSQSDLSAMGITFCQLPYELTASRAQALEV